MSYCINGRIGELINCLISVFTLRLQNLSSCDTTTESIFAFALFSFALSFIIFMHRLKDGFCSVTRMVSLQ